MAQLFNTPLYSDANLQEYYKLEDTSGKNGNTLTNNNSVTFTSARYVNGANLGTSNTNKSLTVASNLGITSYTVSLVCWVKLTTEIAAGTYIFFQNVNNTTKNFVALNYEYNGGAQRLVASEYKVGGGDVHQKATYSIVMGTTNWYHLALTSNGTNFFLYVNGVQQATNTCPISGSTAIDNKTNIGFNWIPTGAASGPDQYASAIIDDAAIFNRLLTGAEVQTLANDGGGSFLYNFI